MAGGGGGGLGAHTLTTMAEMVRCAEWAMTGWEESMPELETTDEQRSWRGGRWWCDFETANEHE